MKRVFAMCMLAVIPTIAASACSQRGAVVPIQLPTVASSPSSKPTTFGGTYVGRTPAFGPTLNGVPVFTGTFVLTLTGNHVAGTFYYGGDFGGTVDGTLQDISNTAPFGKLTLHLSEADGDTEIDADLTAQDGSSFSGRLNPCDASDCSATFTRP